MTDYQDIWITASYDDGLLTLSRSPDTAQVKLAIAHDGNTTAIELTWDQARSLIYHLDCATSPVQRYSAVTQLHLDHYRSCGCLGASNKCCVPTCPCHTAKTPS